MLFTREQSKVVSFELLKKSSLPITTLFRESQGRGKSKSALSAKSVDEL